MIISQNNQPRTLKLKNYKQDIKRITRKCGYGLQHKTNYIEFTLRAHNSDFYSVETLRNWGAPNAEV